MPFEIRGMDAATAQVRAMMEGAEDAARRAVKAGAKALAERLREQAPVETGALRDSIKPGPVKYSAADGYYCEVKPVGSHPATGEPLAKIGNILEYGRSYGATKKAGLGWFHPTVKAAEGEITAAMQAEFERAQRK